MKKKYVNAKTEITALDLKDVITISLIFVNGDNGNEKEDGGSYLDIFGS